ncbi:40917_t:CDS:2 [Gigaspora margarita]|uniref:40917_t:CDS:1 n=1 Tax=Gigaspora margarita TaxID=4874 RepID=A0ABN7UP88_GIGMA|nr:40917_t:CDS:2 [Gigaspora margarita]
MPSSGKIFLFYLYYFNEFLKLILAFTPKNTVWGHNSALVGSKIYYTGGVIPNETIWKNVFDFLNTPNQFATQSKEFYYLDLSSPFKINEAITSWVDLSSSSIVPPHSWSAFSLCGSDNSTLVMFGGDFGVTNPANLVFIYDTKTLKWSNPTTIGQPSNLHTRGVCDFKTGKMYMYSGSMYILDIKTLTWGVWGSSIPGRFDYTLTLLPNGNIVIIGGVDASGTANMLTLPLYNVNENTWSLMNATGYRPTPRGHHSSVLSEDGRIIVYGGYAHRRTLVPASDDLIVLDTKGPIFIWSKANVSTLSPPSRCYHSAILVDHYMIVAFGRNDLYLPSAAMNEIYILDISDKFDYKWVIEFRPVNNDTASTATLAFLFILVLVLLMIHGILQ